MSDDVRDACPDGGTCGHWCTLVDGKGLPCFRVMAAGPFSGTYPGDTWPADMEAEHHQAYAAKQARERDDATAPPLCAAPLDERWPLGPRCDRDPHQDADHADTDRRLVTCLERWPEAETLAYDPRCCRFPKSCSASATHPEHLTTADVEPEPRPVAVAPVASVDPIIAWLDDQAKAQGAAFFQPYSDHETAACVIQELRDARVDEIR